MLRLRSARPWRLAGAARAPGRGPRSGDAVPAHRQHRTAGARARARQRLTQPRRAQPARAHPRRGRQPQHRARLRGADVRSIAEEAAVSLQAFYAHFSGKEDAFLVAYEVGHTRASRPCSRGASRPTGPTKFARASPRCWTTSRASPRSRTWRSSTRSPPPTAADRSAKGAIAYARLLAPDPEDPALPPLPPGVIIEAISGGLFELCFSLALRNRLHVLPSLLPGATYFALAPFIGAEQAAARPLFEARSQAGPRRGSASLAAASHGHASLVGKLAPPTHPRPRNGGPASRSPTSPSRCSPARTRNTTFFGLDNSNGL